jgi:ornithine cyclodeaminase/alanine dehydrogenase-like protein (mu-crystallin family)
MTRPPHLDAGRIFRFAPFDEVVAEMRATFATGPAVVPRQSVPLSGGGDLLVMPAAAGHTAGVKTVTARADPAPGGQPAVQGLYVLFDGGAVVATLDGAALTALRTPAVSALATDALARADVTRLAVFGTGVQAREHIRAMRWMRPSLERVEVVGRDPAGTDRFVAMLRGEGHPVVSASPSGASGADLICTCTSSSVPVLTDDAVKPGAHVNAIGSYRPERRELGETLMGRARVVVDDRAAALAESGDLVLAVAAGTMSPADVAGDLAGLARREVRRETADEVTVFVSVGLAVADLAVATLAARNAGLVND